MKRFSLILITILLFSTICKSQINNQNFTWRVFYSEQGKFKASFPYRPEESVGEVDGLEGKTQKFKYEVYLSDMTFVVWYSDLIVPIFNQNVLKLAYDKSRNKILKNSNIKLMRERDIWLGKNLGREIVLEMKGEVITKRMYIIGNRKFDLMRSVNESSSNNKVARANINKFLDSFQLTDQ
jgi:hypothetical protein